MNYFIIIVCAIVVFLVCYYKKYKILFFIMPLNILILIFFNYVILPKLSVLYSVAEDVKYTFSKSENHEWKKLKFMNYDYSKDVFYGSNKVDSKYRTIFFSVYKKNKKTIIQSGIMYEICESEIIFTKEDMDPVLEAFSMIYPDDTVYLRQISELISEIFEEIYMAKKIRYIDLTCKIISKFVGPYQLKCYMTHRTDMDDIKLYLEIIRYI